MSYDDIINLPHHISKVHRQMTMSERAAQFAPFAALTGYDAAIKESARVTDKRSFLDEEELYQINRTVIEALNNKAFITLTYFIKDERKKEGGRFEEVSGFIKKIDNEFNTLIINNLSIPLEDITKAYIDKKRHPED